MKRRLLLVAVLCLLTVAVSATHLDFQTPADLSQFSCTGLDASPGTCTLASASAGGNSYIYATHQIYHYHGIKVGGVPSTYAAATVISIPGHEPYSYMGIALLDSSGNSMYSVSFGNIGTHSSPFRVEMKMIGGDAHIYINGFEKAVSGTLSQNPSYVIFTPAWDGFDANYDDIVFGDTENKYIFGNPDPNVYVIQKDFVNTASSGFYYASGGLINSQNMTSTWSRSNLTTNVNESIVLRNYNTGIVYATRYTGFAKTTGTVSWALSDELFKSSAPNGLYEVTIPGSGTASEAILYKSVGASIAFNSKSYSAGDTATITYSIDNSPYYDTSLYTYRIDLISLTTGKVVHTQDITPLAPSSFITYQFTTSDPQGQYYAALITTPRGTTTDYWMGYDYTTLVAYATFSGYVNDASTANPISGAIVNLTQGTITATCTTASSGYYSTTGYLANGPIFLNATATGYHSYKVNITPLSASGISLNITLNSTSPSDSGNVIWGVARDGIFGGLMVTGGYGRPIAGAAVVVENTSVAEYYTRITNNAGGYMCGELESCYLDSGRLYRVSGSKAGYNNSQVYKVVMP